MHDMARWILLLVSLGGLLLMFFGPTSGWVALGLFAFLFCSIGSTLAFAHARIASSARHEDFEAQRYLLDRTATPSGDASAKRD